MVNINSIFRTTLLLITFSIFGNLLIAQSTTFSIDLSTNYGFKKQSTNTYTSDYNSIRPNFDSTKTIEEHTISTVESTNLYTPKLGYGIHGNLRFHKNKFSIKTGFGVNYYKFSQLSTNFKLKDLKIVSSDTLNQPFVSPYGHPYPVMNGECIEFENQYSDIDLDHAVYYRIINLRIPLTLEYMIIPNKLRIGLGILLQTPLYSSLEGENIRIESHVSDQKKICKYVKKPYKVANRTGISNLQIGLTGYATYYIHNNIGINVGYTAETENIFYQNPSGNSFLFLPNKYTPFNIFAGVEYKFGQKVKTEINN